MHKVHRQFSRVPNARVKLCPGVSASVAGCMPHRAENQILLGEVDMDSGMIGKIEKSKRYAEEPERICFEEFRVTFQGTNSKHQVSKPWHRPNRLRLLRDPASGRRGDGLRLIPSFLWLNLAP